MSTELNRIPEKSEDVVGNEELIDQYNKLELSEYQKKDFHVILLQLRTLEDLQSFEDVTYEDVRELLCCGARTCKCGSKYAESRPMIIPQKPADLKYQRFSKIKEDSAEIIIRDNKLAKYKARNANQYPDLSLDSGRSMKDLRKHIQYLKGLCYELHQELKSIL